MEIEDIRRIEFKPGDKLVLRIKGHVSFETADKMREQFAKFAPGVPVLILEDGASLDVLSEAAA